MERISKLKKLISDLDKKKTDNELYKYIGTGNPNAEILIIGKESSIADTESDQFIFELKSNFELWKNKTKYNQDDIKDFCTWDNYDPIYPYKGQTYNIENKSTKNKGTSRTWYTYQKLINYIFDTPENKNIDFHKNVFITEVNSTPSKKTIDADISSINFRKDIILKSDFFQSFPIVIISGVGYFKISTNRNEIEEIFNVIYSEKKLSEGKKHQPYWIHLNKNNQSPKLLINTYQLSIGVSDNLLKEMANEIRKKIITSKS